MFSLHFMLLYILADSKSGTVSRAGTVPEFGAVSSYIVVIGDKTMGRKNSSSNYFDPVVSKMGRAAFGKSNASASYQRDRIIGNVSDSLSNRGRAGGYSKSYNDALRAYRKGK